MNCNFCICLPFKIMASKIVVRYPGSHFNHTVVNQNKTACLRSVRDGRYSPMIFRGLPSGYVNHLLLNPATSMLILARRSAIRPTDLSTNWTFLLLSQNSSLGAAHSNFQSLHQNMLHLRFPLTRQFHTIDLFLAFCCQKASSSLLKNWYSPYYLFIERRNHYP